MPLVRISLRSGQSPDFKQRLGDCIYRAMVATMSVPANDRFQIISEHDPAGLIYDSQYLGIHRTDGIIVIQVTLNSGRTLAVKQAFYAKVAALLHEELRVRVEDVFINLVEVPKENWSFGHGLAQYVPWDESGKT